MAQPRPLAGGSYIRRWEWRAQKDFGAAAIPALLLLPPITGHAGCPVTGGVGAVSGGGVGRRGVGPWGRVGVGPSDGRKLLRGGTARCSLLAAGRLAGLEDSPGKTCGAALLAAGKLPREESLAEDLSIGSCAWPIGLCVVLRGTSRLSFP